MKLCVTCGGKLVGADWRCFHCDEKPATIDGVLSFAPALSKEGDGFEASFFNDLAPLEAHNFWFQARNDLIVWLLKRYFPGAMNFLEIGCGTGFVLSGIAQACPDLHLSASEVFIEGLHYARNREPDCEFFQMDARNIPFKEEFDVIGAFDVLEHIAEDELVVAEMRKAIKPGGGIVLTVPQHPSLWSQADEYAHHVRRYTTKELESKVQNAGFEIIRRTSFVSLLLPLMMVSRLKQRTPDEDHDPLAELRIGGFANAALKKVLDLERVLTRMGVSFPVGGSLVMVAQNK